MLFGQSAYLSNRLEFHPHYAPLSILATLELYVEIDRRILSPATGTVGR